MELSPDVVRYVMSHYLHLMNEKEWGAYYHVLDTIKSRHPDVQKHPSSLKRFAESFSTDPEVWYLLRDGYEAFFERTAARIVNECGAKILFNDCPKCAKLTRTPRARQCRFCGFDWHSTP